MDSPADQGGFLLPGYYLLPEEERRLYEPKPWSRWERLRYEAAELIVRAARLIHHSAGMED